MRWLPVSATTIIPEKPEMPTPFGDENSPSPAPNDPNPCKNVPFAANTWMRWLPVSATATTLSPMGSVRCTAMPSGDENSPSPVPYEPNSRARAPFSVKT